MKQLGIYCVIVWGMLVSQTTAAASPVTAQPLSQAPAELYIIIDDMGYRATDEQAFALPESVTFSILPHTPQGQAFAERAHAQSRDVMLHLPMEAQSDKPLGPGAITSSMYANEITATFEAALASVPYAIGVNNHMGSVLTASGKSLQPLMNVIKHTGLFFVDSRTTRFTVAQQVAREKQIPNARRHVFLDHEQTEAFMNEQWHRAMALARKHPKVIIIAHPHPGTIEFLQKKLADLPAQDFALKSMHDYFEKPEPPQRKYANSTQVSVAAPN